MAVVAAVVAVSVSMSVSVCLSSDCVALWVCMCVCVSVSGPVSVSMSVSVCLSSDCVALCVYVCLCVYLPGGCPREGSPPPHEERLPLQAGRPHGRDDPAAVCWRRLHRLRWHGAFSDTCVGRHLQSQRYFRFEGFSDIVASLV